MLNLVAAALFFISIHLMVAGTRVRDALTARIGLGPYMGLFSLSSVAGLAWLGLSFAQARGSAGDMTFWSLTPATRGVQITLQLVAMLLIVPGLTTRNPTAVGSEGALDQADTVKGMVRISRHPFLWGVAIWAAGHLLVNGDTASIILFTTMLALALLGTASIDAKRKRAAGAKWDAFAAQTSNIPFGAVAAGKQALSLAEIGWWRLLLAVGVWAMLAWAHPLLFGVRALP